jgi:hypothetical protein
MTRVEEHVAERVAHAKLRAALAQLDKRKANGVARARTSGRHRSRRRRLRFALIGLGVGAWVGDAASGEPLPVALLFACVGLVIAAAAEIRAALRR